MRVPGRPHDEPVELRGACHGRQGIEPFGIGDLVDEATLIENVEKV